MGFSSPPSHRAVQRTWRGVIAGDLILAVGGRTVTGLDDLFRQLDKDTIDKPCELLLIREGRLLSVKITPRERKQG